MSRAVMPLSQSNARPCPHLESGDARCNHRFTLPRMDQAFSVCMSGWRGCPVYQMIHHEKADRETQRPAVSVTVRASDAILARLQPARPGRAGVGQPLRPTGS